MLNICKHFVNLGEDFFTYVNPQGLNNPRMIHINNELLKRLNLDDELISAKWLAILSGNEILNEYPPLASNYCGHQFGVWVSQLGDGRALLIAEHKSDNIIWELQLKGAGVTPYSRMGDGRAVLRSSIREYLCSHAMAKLNIPTTYALALVNSDTLAMREEAENAAIVLRVAQSFIRFGHFELFASRNQISELNKLVEFVINSYYPECNNTNDPVASLLDSVAKNTATTIAKWQSVGFCHGVMNSDNMSILGLTLDYGPFGFLEDYNVNHICNTSDHHGRYTYGNQPEIAMWNLSCLANALLPLSQEELIKNSLDNFANYFNQAYINEMGNKLGISNFSQADLGLLKNILLILENTKLDWTNFWRKLSHLGSNDKLSFKALIDNSQFDDWLNSYFKRRSEQELSFNESQMLMLNSNPAIVLRNYLAHNAIEKAKNNDFTELNTLFRALSTPYEEHAEFLAYYNESPSSAKILCVSCSS